MADENIKPSRWRKYSPYVLVPTAIFSVIAIDLINNVNHREAVEKVFPPLVNFIRKYYGFDDENPEEMKRIARIHNLQQSKIRVVVKYDTSGQSIIQEVDGMTKCTDISKTSSIYQTYHTNILSFPDLAEEGPMELTSRKLKDVSHELRVGRDITTDSEWSPKPIQETPSRFVTQQQLILQRYNNMIGTVGDGFRAFYRLGVPSAAPFTLLPFQDNVEVVKKTPKELAVERIEELQLRLSQLQEDRLIGFRDIDSVDQEIRATKNEISSLQRKYINTFSLW
eukprot:gene13205-14494_t